MTTVHVKKLHYLEYNNKKMKPEPFEAAQRLRQCFAWVYNDKSDEDRIRNDQVVGYFCR